MIKHFVINEDYNNCRFDRFLKEKFFLTHGLICKSLRKGFVKLNSKKDSHNVILKNGDIVSIADVIYSDFDKINKKNDPKLRKNNNFKLQIIHEDDNIIVVNKQYGISTQGGDRIHFSLIDEVKKHCENARIVHRLDKETTGIIVFAKNKQTASEISEKFRKNEIKKEYVTLLDGVPETKNGIISTKSRKKYSNNIGSRVVFDEDGEYAESYYEILEIIDNQALVFFRPKTGKMHQIRIHALEINCPIVGDEKYNNNYKKGQKLKLKSVFIDLGEFGRFSLSKEFNLN